MYASSSCHHHAGKKFQNPKKKEREGTDIRIILACMSTSRFFTSSGRRDGLDSTLKEIAKLQSLDEITRQQLSQSSPNDNE